MNTSRNITELLAKPLWQMTGDEYVTLHAYAVKVSRDEEGAVEPHTRVAGVRALAEFCGCCESTLYNVMRQGALDSAILSRIGKRIVFDGEKARELAQAYIQEHRQSKKSKNDKVNLNNYGTES